MAIKNDLAKMDHFASQVTTIVYGAPISMNVVNKW